jgi:hypothetical protein
MMPQEGEREEYLGIGAEVGGKIADAKLPGAPGQAVRRTAG